MPYYSAMRGDYSTYGYGQGDPGFLSSLWKGIKRVAAPAIGFALGGPAGAALAGTLGRGGRTPPIMQVQQPRLRSTVQYGVGPISARGSQYYPPVPSFAGAPMRKPTPVTMETLGGAGTGCCPRGFHLAKDGSGKCVRNRRMNVANPRALRRSMRRVQGFEKLARRTISFTRRVKMKK